MAALTDAVVPLLLLGASCYSLRKRADSYGLMVRGAADGLRMLAHIAPALIVLLTAVQMLQAAGAVQLLERFPGPVLAWTGIPPQTLGLVLIRPISGSAASTPKSSKSRARWSWRRFSAWRTALWISWKQDPPCGKTGWRWWRT